MTAAEVAAASDAELAAARQAELPSPADGIRFALLDVGGLFDAAGTIAAAIAAAPDAEPFGQARAVLVGLDAAGLLIVRRA